MKFQIQRALISLSDKDKLDTLAQVLHQHNIEIIASGGTAKYIQNLDIPVVSVSDTTGFPEILDGRVKTLHPKIHAGILAKRSDESHTQTLYEQGIGGIDLVVVNLYPFEKTVSNTESTEEDIIEQIDIGGPTLIRSAAKNFQDVVVLTSPDQYEQFIEYLQVDSITPEICRQYALEAFTHTAKYDAAISQYFVGESQQCNLSLSVEQSLRYGENPHQEGQLCKVQGQQPWQGLDNLKQLSGKELSYNNWLDIHAGVSLISEFEEDIPACAILKHNIPCGVAIAETIEESYSYALDCDPISAFGGIVVFNQKVNYEVAKQLTEIFLEVIIAPEFDAEAVEILSQKKNLRLIQSSLIPTEILFKQMRSVMGNGILCQDYDGQLLDKDNLTVVTECQPEQSDWVELLFAYRVVKHIKSNAIAIVNGNRTVGLCGGQTNRVNSVRIALEEASDLAVGGILASDGFFPFPDSIELAAKAGIKAIIQPGGSVNDQKVIDAANKYKIPMIVTGMRHFNH